MSQLRGRDGLAMSQLSERRVFKLAVAIWGTRGRVWSARREKKMVVNLGCEGRPTPSPPNPGYLLPVVGRLRGQQGVRLSLESAMSSQVARSW